MIKMFKLFEIKEGKFQVLPSMSIKSLKGFFISSVIVIIIALLSSWLKFDEKDLWKIYQILIQKLNLQYEIPEIIDNQKRIDAKVELEVDKALLEYQRLTGDDGTVRIPSPIFSEKPIDENLCYTDECKSLGGEMRLCSPWVEGCVNKN